MKTNLHEMMNQNKIIFADQEYAKVLIFDNLFDYKLIPKAYKVFKDRSVEEIEYTNIEKNYIRFNELSIDYALYYTEKDKHEKDESFDLIDIRYQRTDGEVREALCIQVDYKDTEGNVDVTFNTECDIIKQDAKLTNQITFEDGTIIPAYTKGDIERHMLSEDPTVKSCNKNDLISLVVVFTNSFNLPIFYAFDNSEKDIVADTIIANGYIDPFVLGMEESSSDYELYHNNYIIDNTCKAVVDTSVSIDNKFECRYDKTDFTKCAYTDSFSFEGTMQDLEDSFKDEIDDIIADMTDKNVPNYDEYTLKKINPQPEDKDIYKVYRSEEEFNEATRKGLLDQYKLITSRKMYPLTNKNSNGEVDEYTCLEFKDFEKWLQMGYIYDHTRNVLSYEEQKLGDRSTSFDIIMHLKDNNIAAINHVGDFTNKYGYIPVLRNFNGDIIKVLDV